jgi:DNA-binding MurR/RpiR family transcriptional regulator
VRFAQSLGYKGFPEMREALVQETRKRIQKQARFLEAPPSAASTLVEVARRDVANIQNTLSHVNQVLMESAVERLRGARRIALMGRGISQHMADLLGYLLTLAGLPTLSGHSADFTNQIANLDEHDLVVALSFHPYSRETIEAAQFARDRKVPILAFSDRLDAPLAKLATLTLTVPGENLLYSHSMVAFAVLANALVTSIATKNPNLALNRVREAERAAAQDYVPDR